MNHNSISKEVKCV